jgi:hypothetical protein
MSEHGTAMARRLVTTLLALLALSFQAKAASDPPVLDASAVPYVGAKGRAGYAEDLRVVWPGHESAAPPPPPGPLLQSDVFAIVPDPRYIWRGPQAARGLYVWAHGKSGANADARGEQPPCYVRAFNNAGFDVVRHDREPVHDYADAAAEWEQSALRTLRGMGWRRIVAGGQSRGSWNALQMLDEPGLVDDVVAVSPANFGGSLVSDNSAALYSILHAAKAPAARVVVVQFRGDPFVTDLDRRAGLFRDALPPRVGAFMLIDQPPGFTGHGAGNTSAFALKYARCLLHFVDDPAPPAACE